MDTFSETKLETKRHHSWASKYTVYFLHTFYTFENLSLRKKAYRTHVRDSKLDIQRFSFKVLQYFFP